MLTFPGYRLHGRKYQLPRQPTVIVCVDGFDPEYLEAGCSDGILPNLSKFLNTGFHVTAKCAMPSLTNPNNVSIITGVPTTVCNISPNSRQKNARHQHFSPSILPKFPDDTCTNSWKVHGIAGNFYLDKATGEEHMILDGMSTLLHLKANSLEFWVSFRAAVGPGIFRSHLIVPFDFFQNLDTLLMPNPRFFASWIYNPAANG